jgi:hypothetical protein
MLREVGPEPWLETGETGDLSQGQLVYDEELETHVVPEGELFGRHDEEAMQSFIDLFGVGNDEFNTFPAAELLNGDLLEPINDFDHEAVIQQAETYGQ